MENKRNYKIEIAHAIFLACNGNIDEAMKHEKMPYRRKNTVQKMAKEYKWYEKARIHKPIKNGLPDVKIQRIHKVFLENNGHISKTSELTGCSRATISKYSKAYEWNKKLLQDSRIIIKQNKEYSANEEDIIEILKKLRQRLIDVIINHEQPDIDPLPALGILPKTLSEAIKALIDIDKRITERENQNLPSALDPYQAILRKCAEVIPEDEPEV